MEAPREDSEVVEVVVVRTALAAAVGTRVAAPRGGTSKPQVAVRTIQGRTR